MMPQQRKRRLYWIIGLLLSIGLAASLVLYALKQNISLYLTPSEIVQQKLQMQTSNIRLGGVVVKNSLQRSTGLKLGFQVTDFSHVINVRYQGVLPTLFREGQGVVIDGHFDSAGQLFIASRILAKHDENYRPPGIHQLHQVRPRAGR